MGMFDDVHVGQRVGQVKLWECSLNTYRVGDQVSSEYSRDGSYSITMKEGGYVNVLEDHILSWTDTPVF